jgi:hypothetical protein
MSAPVIRFLGDLLVQFPIKHPNDAAERQWTQAMIRNLSGFSPEVLDEAAKRIIDSRVRRDFPLPAECRKACIEVDERRKTKPFPVMADEERKDRPYSEWRCRLADDLIQCEMGRQACHEGWIGTLWDYCREHKRLPDWRQVPKLQATARGVEDDIDWLKTQAPTTLNRQLIALGQSMIERREQHKRTVLGEGRNR